MAGNLVETRQVRSTGATSLNTNTPPQKKKPVKLECCTSSVPYIKNQGEIKTFWNILKLKIDQQHPLPTRNIEGSHSSTRKIGPGGNLDRLEKWRAQQWKLHMHFFPPNKTACHFLESGCSHDTTKLVKIRFFLVSAWNKIRIIAARGIASLTKTSRK